MLPNAHNLPTMPANPSVGVSIARPVRFDLCAPEFGIVLWPGRMCRTTVPKTTVDEDGYLGFCETHVGGSAGYVLQGNVHAIP